MKFSAFFAITALSAPLALAAPLGLKPTPVRRSEAAAESVDVNSAEVDTASLAKATDTVLYSTIDLGSQDSELLSTTIIGADNIATVFVQNSNQFNGNNNNNNNFLVAAQLNAVAQQQLLNELFGQIFGNNIFDNNDLEDALNLLAQILTIQFNSLNSFSGFGFNSANWDNFNSFANSFVNNIFGIDNVQLEDILNLVNVLSGLNVNQLANLFGKQDFLFSNDFLSSNNINDFGGFVNNLDDILNLAGLNNANFDENDLFDLINLIGLLSSGNLNLDAFNAIQFLNLNNNFGLGLNDLLNSLNINNNLFDSNNNFSGNDLFDNNNNLFVNF